MPTSGVVAIIPMKPLNRSKTRLAGTLSPEGRARLSLAMFTRVLSAATQSSADEVWVLGGDSEIKRATIQSGATWLQDDGDGLNDSLNICFRKAFGQGLAAMYLAGDLPFVTSEDVDAMVEAFSSSQNLVLAPAHRDRGTNSIVAPCGSGFYAALGDSSFERHKKLAESLKLDFTICDRPGLGLDLDTPDDLQHYQAMRPEFFAELFQSVEQHAPFD